MASLRKRNGNWQLQWYQDGKQIRRSLGTASLQVAKEKKRQFESRRAQGDDNPLPTKTPIGELVGAYVRHIRTVKMAKSAQTDVYYLRQLFGACCPELEITSRRVGPASVKRPVRKGERSPDQ